MANWPTQPWSELEETDWPEGDLALFRRKPSCSRVGVNRVGECASACFVELDNSGVIEEDTGPVQEMGDTSIEVTDEMLEIASAKRAEAMEAVSEGQCHRYP